MARVVGLDVGERRIGIAISDATRTLARPVGTVRIASLDQAAAVIGRDIDRFAHEEDGVDTVVVGLPRRLDGRANEMTARVEAFAAQLRQRTGQAVVLQDERLSSIEAESRLASREKDWRVRKARLDSAAAAVILQDYLDGEVRS